MIDLELGAILRDVVWFYHVAPLVDPLDGSAQSVLVGVDHAAGNHGLTQANIQGLINANAVSLYFAIMAWNYDPPWVDQGYGGDDTRYTYTSAYAYMPDGTALNWIFRTQSVVGVRILYLFHIDMVQQHYKTESKISLRQRALDALGLDASGRKIS